MTTNDTEANSKPPLKVGFVLSNVDGQKQTIEHEQLAKFADEIGLSAAAPGRYTALLAFQLLASQSMLDLDPHFVMREIRRLEGGPEDTLTKPETEFKEDGTLGGLWHKHFTSSQVSMVAGAISAGRPQKVIKQLAIEELSGGATPEALGRFVRRVVVGGYERRAERGELTGEWLVYLPRDEGNLYLCLARHQSGNEEILGYLRGPCVAEFPFLRSALPNAFSEVESTD